MPLVGFELATPASEWTQIHALDLRPLVLAIVAFYSTIFAHVLSLFVNRYFEESHQFGCKHIHFDTCANIYTVISIYLQEKPMSFWLI